MKLIPKTIVLLQLLKFSGALLFLWIVSRIDFEQLLEHLRGSNVPLLALSLLFLLLVYVMKTLRWHTLVCTMGLRPTLRESWRLYNIGLFLAILTPARIGELARATYLIRAGMHPGTALSLVIVERLVDIIAIGGIAIFAIGWLFGSDWMNLALIFAPFACALLILLWNKRTHISDLAHWFEFVSLIAKPQMLSTVTILTLVGWMLYFVWGILIARSIGIAVEIPTLVAAFTLTGIIALLPIAPAGLGTRDAALLYFLGPFGVSAAQAVSLGVIMFVSIILSGTLGMYYWLTKEGKREDRRNV